MALNLFQELMGEKENPEREMAEVLGSYCDGFFYATVHYKGDVFCIKETNELQLMESIKLAVEKRDEVKNE